MKKILNIVLFFFLLSCESESFITTDGSTSGTGGSTAKFEVIQNRLYVLDGQNHVKIFSLFNQTKPEFKGEFNVDLIDVETIFGFKSLLFFGAANGMAIYSIENPDDPTYISHYEHVTACDPVIANDSMAYVTLRSGTDCNFNAVNELHVLDIRNLREIKEVKTLTMQNPHGLTFLQDTLLAVCNSQGGISLFSIANPYEPSLKQRITNHHFTDVIAVENHLIAIGNAGVSFIELSDSLRIIKSF